MSTPTPAPSVSHRARLNLPGNMHPGLESECMVPGCAARAATTLRDAAAAMRSDYPTPDENPDRLMRAVADWLSDEAEWQGRESGPVRLSSHNPALIVARIYLDGASPGRHIDPASAE